ncbi:MAG: nucleotidyltransferase family protein [Anaerolineales bacterium]|nr:nucleotidyltransferase family protein [Anaerolineales bacterium]
MTDTPLTAAVVTAGGVPRPSDPLYALTQGRNKALLEIAGRPMLQWVLDALSGAAGIGRVVVVGLPADAHAFTCARPLSYLPNSGSLLGNVEAGVKAVLTAEPECRHALLVSSDIPAITPASVDWTLATAFATDHEIYYSLIAEADMERRFPGAHRSYFTLKEGRFCGGDMTLIQTALVNHYSPAWNELIAARKNVLRQAAIIGFGTLLRMALGQMSIPAAEHAALQRLQIRGRAMRCPNAEAGMDVDKPHQFELVQRDLAQQRAVA